MASDGKMQRSAVMEVVFVRATEAVCVCVCMLDHSVVGSGVRWAFDENMVSRFRSVHRRGSRGLFFLLWF